MKSKLLTEKTVCNNCGSSASSLVSTGTDYEYGTTDDIFSMVRCSDCNLVYLNPRPDVSEFPVLYPAEYNVYNIQSAYDEKQQRSFYYKLRHGLFVKGLGRQLKEFFPERRQLRMLDVGCADGFFLSLFKKVPDFELETHGIDMCEESVAVARASGHTTYVGRFEEVDLPLGYFDLIYSSHVIEHVPDPVAFAQKIGTLLKPGGIVWLRTPNINAADAGWFRDKYWGPYCFPRHFYLYDSESIAKMAKAAGFETVKVAYMPSWVGWVQTMHNYCRDHKNLNQFADRFFSIHDMVKTTPLNFVRNCFFMVLDTLILKCTGRTGCDMVAILKRSA